MDVGLLANPSFTCTLRLPAVFGLEPVTTPREFPRKTVAQAVAAFQACVALRNKGLIDDDLNPVRQEERVLSTFPDYKPEVMDLPDESVIPSPTHDHLSLEALFPYDGDFDSEGRHGLCLQHLMGFTHIALLTRTPLPKVDEIQSMLLHDPIPLEVEGGDLMALARYHTAMGHIAMYGSQALDDLSLETLDCSPDKGYIMVPIIQGETGAIDWETVRKVNQCGSIIGEDKLWPLPDGADLQDMLILTHLREDQKPKIYEVLRMSDTTLEAHRKVMDDEWKARKSKAPRLSEDAAGDEKEEADENAGLRLVPSYSRKLLLEEGDLSQPLLLGRRRTFGSHLFPGRRRGYVEPKERLLAPQFCSSMLISRRVMGDYCRLVPQLCELEAGLKLYALQGRIGLPVNDKSWLRKAITKEDYERLEVLGDSYLKLIMGQYVCQVEPILNKEGLLHSFRSNLVSMVSL